MTVVRAGEGGEGVCIVIIRNTVMDLKKKVSQNKQMKFQFISDQSHMGKQKRSRASCLERVSLPNCWITSPLRSALSNGKGGTQCDSNSRDVTDQDSVSLQFITLHES